MGRVRKLCHTFILVFAIITSIESSCAHKDPNTCSTQIIKDQKDLTQLKHCVKIIGHVELTNFRVTNTTDITSHVLEITDYLLVYRVEGLPSLELIFPNLIIIRGNELLFGEFSLVIFENREIQDIGLKSLLKIRNGHVKIESNPVLCFADTVNWMYLLENNKIQHFTLKDNQIPTECVRCLKGASLPAAEFFNYNCWNIKNFQRKKPSPSTEICSDDCEEGCTIDGKCCSSLCITGCFAEKCHICKDFKDLQGNCVPNCNIPYYKLADKCVTEKECHKMQFIPHAGSCIENCPPSYQQDFSYGVPECNLRCNRNYTIRSKEDLDNLRDCVIIRGSLHIELKEDQTDHIIKDMENVLGSIKEITDYLKVTKSPQLMSLGFLRKLDTIRGEKLLDGEVAFYVVDNFHLEEIWPENHKVAILKGRVFFHLNPRLCYEMILQLAPSIKSSNAISIKDASHNSNGERTICGNEVKPLVPTVEATNATAARIKLKPLNSSDRDVVLGYLFYYKKAPSRNVTMFDGRHGCGRDDWLMDMKLNPNIRHVFTNLKPNTQYAYFVKTFSSIDNNYQKRDWFSDIDYFTTLPSRANAVQKIFAVQIEQSSVIIHWWPPQIPNGIIEKYLIRYEPTNQNRSFSELVGYTANEKPQDNDCNCLIKEKFRGPPPSDIDYYNREKALYDMAVMNFVFVSSKHLEKLEKETEEEDRTRRRRQAETTPMTTIVSNETSKTVLSESELQAMKEAEDELKLNKHFAGLEEKSVREQDTGPEEFPIIPPRKVCQVKNPTKEYQKEHDCDILEIFEGITLPGSVHSYIIDNLDNHHVFRVFVRACIKDVPNGCGPEKSIEVETHKKQ